MQNQKQILFLLKRQNYLEILHTSDNQMLQMKQDVILTLLKEIEELAPSKEENYEMQQLLRYNTLTECPGYKDFETNHKRFETFLDVKRQLDLNPATASLICQSEKRRVPTGRLSKLLSDAILL